MYYHFNNITNRDIISLKKLIMIIYAIALLDFFGDHLY